MTNTQIIIRCPVCGLSVNAPADAELPDEGPVCAMGHEPAPMQTVTVEPRHG